MTNNDVSEKLRGLTLTNTNREIENIFGLPKNSLSNFLSGRKPIPKKYHDKIKHHVGGIFGGTVSVPKNMISDLETIEENPIIGERDKSELILMLVFSTMAKYNCDINDIIDVFVASKQAIPAPKPPKVNHTSNLGDDGQIAALKAEIASLGSSSLANTRKKFLQKQLKALENQ